MPADAPTIVATSGGWRRGVRGLLDAGPLLHHAVELSGAAGRARVCHLGTAGGDQRWFTAEAVDAGQRAGFDVAPLHLFPMPSVDDVSEHVLSCDVVWVEGGSVVNLLAVWRAHGLDAVLRRAWEAGVVLAGVSAGSICWFRGGTTDSFGPELRPVTDALGLLPYGNGVHYDSEAGRRPLVHRLVAAGTLPEAHCTDDGVGLVYRGTRLVEAVREVDGAAAAYVVRREDGRAVEERLPTRRLPLA
ncbi:peptidase E [Kineococcus xinjiangensis]|uniref:Peptidase E n=1 Tax=Kineococcus xinjiangensis TaxID=512762 RepID=A0A2S6IM70_9ACTN|nr:peptidase E [Kineococcus xinjiangensis]PPK95332.1 peptidase E [Kineococcus xinjiangensis]